MTARHQAFVLVFFTAILSGCANEAPVEPVSAETPEPPPINVQVTKLAASALEDRLHLAGRFEPWVEVEVSTELGGTVKQVEFEKGRRVREGQVLARVGTDLLEAALTEADAEFQAAEADFNKTTELFSRQAVPRQDLIEATSLFKRAEARVAQAKLRVERSIIRAPVSGVAVSREVEPGEVIAPGSRITVLHQVDKLKAVAGIPENDIVYFSIGSDTAIEIDAYPGREFRGRIFFLGSAATGQNRTFPVEVEVDNKTSELRPGMIVRLSLVRRVFEDAIVVPRDAVLERDEGSVAFVLDGDRARECKVTTGPSESGKIVVVEGLSVGEELIVKGHRNLIDGQRIRVVDGGEL
ncbi:MAG TPA: efflux RND transporter periplasmic adaptor subunit [Vicinamibacteria bacterium]|nr:efflux RND transporter periplasmic adaptor subunit [Vicinamibacteria bacterium]